MPKITPYARFSVATTTIAVISIMTVSLMGYVCILYKVGHLIVPKHTVNITAINAASGINSINHPRLNKRIAIKIPIKNVERRPLPPDF